MKLAIQLLIILYASPLFAQLSIETRPHDPHGNQGGGPSILEVPKSSGGPSRRDREAEAYGSYLQESMPSSYQPPSYQPSQGLQTFEKAVDYFKSQVKRRNEVREQIQGMDQYETRAKLVEQASEALKVSRAYYLSNEMEEGQIASMLLTPYSI